jgi:hypothetical protein
MSASLPNLSNRLVRAASAEQADLVRHRDRLAGERTALLDQLRRLDEALAAVDHRLEVLGQLVRPPELSIGEGEALQPKGNPAGSSAAQEYSQDVNHGPMLRGPAIREAAVRVLLAQPGHVEALHYRRWYELLLDAGYQVSGKDPVAVFLTQLSRSPVVRKGSDPGVYEVERQAPLRIRQRLERLQAELREVTVTVGGPIELGAVRARRHELDMAITQQERALEEALRVLGREEPQAARPGAANTG